MKNLHDKLAARGARALDDDELLALLTDDFRTAEALLAASGGSLARLAAEELSRLRMMGGLGLQRARLLLAAAEFGRRVAAAQAQETVTITGSDDVVRLFRPQLEDLAHEECWVLHLSGSNRILERQRVSQGGVDCTIVDHRLILVHTPPSGSAEPSPQDKVLTERLAQAAALFDIRLVDHLVIARQGHYSFCKAGLLK